MQGIGRQRFTRVQEAEAMSDSMARQQHTEGEPPAQHGDIAIIEIDIMKRVIHACPCQPLCQRHVFTVIICCLYRLVFEGKS